MASPLQPVVPTLQQPKPPRTLVHLEQSPNDAHPPTQQRTSLHQPPEHFWTPAPTNAPTNAARLPTSGVPPSRLTGPFPPPPAPVASHGHHPINTLYMRAPSPPEESDRLGAVQATSHPVSSRVPVNSIPTGITRHHDQIKSASGNPSPAQSPGKARNRSKTPSVEASQNTGLKCVTKPPPPVAAGPSTAYRQSRARARSAPGLISPSPNPFDNHQPPRGGSRNLPATASSESGAFTNTNEPSDANDSRSKQDSVKP